MFQINPKEKIKYANMLEFAQTSSTYRVLHQDCQRALWRYQILFQDVKRKDVIRVMQCIFERFFVDVWANIPLELQDQYYQGITDCVEIVFGAYINLNAILHNCDWFQYDSDGFKTFYGDVSQFMYLTYEDAVKYSVYTLIRVYQFNHFDVNQMNKNITLLFNVIKQNDRPLYKLISQSNPDMLSCFVLQYTNSFFLHNTNNLRLSIKLVLCVLKYNNSGLIHLIQMLLSVCLREYAPQLKRLPFKFSPESEMQVLETITIENDNLTTSCCELFSHGIDNIMSNNINCYHILELIDKFEK